MSYEVKLLALEKEFREDQVEVSAGSGQHLNGNRR